MTTEKIKAKDLPQSLTDDKKVISSMKAIQRAGFWAFLIAVTLPFMLVLIIVLAPDDKSQLLPIYVSAYLIGSAYLGYSGWKMNRLRGGRSITILLSLNTVIGLSLFVGIFPFIMAISSIIALTRIRTFRKWQKHEESKVSQGHTKAEKGKSKGIIIPAMICGTLVIASVMGGLIYMQHQNSVQKEKEFQQRKQLVEYEQTQLNKRNEDDNGAIRCAARANSGQYRSIYTSFGC